MYLIWISRPTKCVHDKGGGYIESLYTYKQIECNDAYLYKAF